MNKPFPSTNLPGLLYGTEKVENSPAFAPRKDWGEIKARGFGKIRELLCFSR